MTNNVIKVKRDENGKVVAGIVSRAFYNKANKFGTTEFNMWEEFIKRYSEANMEVIRTTKTAAKPKAEKKIRPTYEKMIDFIKTQDNAEEYLEEMQKIKKMTAINGNSYNTVVKWFNNTFENTSVYQLVFKGILEEKPEAEKVVNIKSSENAAA